MGQYRKKTIAQVASEAIYDDSNVTKEYRKVGMCFENEVMFVKVSSMRQSKILSQKNLGL